MSTARSRNAPCFALGLLLGWFHGPCAGAGDFKLMVGLRAVIAASIRDAGHECPDVKHIRHAGTRGPLSVLVVLCGPPGNDQVWDHRPYRVLADTDGEYWVEPDDGEPAGK